FAPGFFPYL
nr:Chain C, RESIDUE PEPTIDE1I7R_F Chain F, RESIDUE PEPTIDE